MNNTTLLRIIARANQEMQNAGIVASTNLELAITERIVNFCIDGCLPQQDTGWIYIVARSDHLILIFGNLRTGKNFACFAANTEKLKTRSFANRIWISFLKELLNARSQRERLEKREICMRDNDHRWKLYKIGEENV